MPARWALTRWWACATMLPRWAASRRRPKCCATARRWFWSSVRPTVVVVGAGFGGLRAARALRRAPVEVLLVDRHNYHLFQPLLYQVATAGLEPEGIARPVRAILSRQRNFEFRLGEVTAVDFAARVVRTDAGEVAYDHLIL